jgi:cytoskeletal protein CcmA (bactofilin family)
MFRRTPDKPDSPPAAPERVDSVLGSGLTWQGNLNGSGGVRIEGAYDGEVQIHGIVVIGETGRMTCDQLLAATVVVAGSLKGNIKAYRVEMFGGMSLQPLLQPKREHFYGARSLWKSRWILD